MDLADLLNGECTEFMTFGIFSSSRTRNLLREELEHSQRSLADALLGMSERAAYAGGSTSASIST